LVRLNWMSVGNMFEGEQRKQSKNVDLDPQPPKITLTPVWTQDNYILQCLKIQFMVWFPLLYLDSILTGLRSILISSSKLRFYFRDGYWSVRLWLQHWHPK
jgi:hypothetical protein